MTACISSAWPREMDRDLIIAILEAQEELYIRMAFEAEALAPQLGNGALRWASERRAMLEAIRGSGNTYKQPEIRKETNVAGPTE